MGYRDRLHVIPSYPMPGSRRTHLVTAAQTAATVIWAGCVGLMILSFLAFAGIEKAVEKTVKKGKP
jgi:hypothetical protein